MNARTRQGKIPFQSLPWENAFFIVYAAPDCKRVFIVSRGYMPPQASIPAIPPEKNTELL